MKGFKKCNNGMFYKSSLSTCPYCKNCDGNSSSDDSTSVTDDSTEFFGSGSTSTEATKSTQVFGGDSTGESTEIFGGSSSSSNTVKVSNSDSNPIDMDRTFIGGADNSDETNDEGSNKSDNSKPRKSRKLVGWIISYTLDPMGVDYRIYEGNNSIGKAAGNTITIAKDVTISSKHVVILYKKGKFYIKDEMSTNGTFLNGEEIDLTRAYELNDCDEIRLGDSVFKFRSAE